VAFGGGVGGAANVLAQLGTVKGTIAGVWETPSPALRQQATEASRALDAAIKEANALLDSARSAGRALSPFNRTLGVP